MNKRIGLLVLLVGILLLGGCNLKEKISENITEGLLEKAIGDNADIDIDGEEFTIKGEDGEEIVFDNENGMVIEGEDGSVMASGGVYDWPEDQAAQYLPKLEEGKITYIFNGPESCALYLEEISEENYEDYMEVIIDKGFTGDKVESISDTMMIYSAKSEKGVIVSVMYYVEENLLQLTVDTSEIE